MVAAVAAKTAASNPGASIAIALVGLLVLKNIPNLLGDALGDAAKAAAGVAADAAGATVEGTGDFLQGFFSDEQTITADDFISSIPLDERGQFAVVVPRSKLSPDVLEVPTAQVIYEDRYRIPIDLLPDRDRFFGPDSILAEGGFENGIVVRGDTVLNDASIAADLGARLNDPFTGLYTNSFFGSLGGPSIQDAVGATGDAFSATQDFFGGLF